MGLAQNSTRAYATPDVARIKDLTPIFSLDSERQQELARNARCITYPAGCRLFSIGEQDDNILYLLRGTVDLQNARERYTLVAGTEKALLPIDTHRPHQYNAVVSSDAEVLIVDRNLMDILLTWRPFSSYDVEEIDSTDFNPDDWMASILQSPVFQRIPPIKIQCMFQKLETLPVREHEVIFLQGDAGDYYYLIQQGKCIVLRTQDREDSIVAELSAGQGFGEEALLSNDSRNATVIMRTDGILLRLAKEDFDDLLKQPVVETINMDKAKKLSARNPVWLDVRQPEEHQISAFEGSINIPLYRLRETLAELGRDRPYIVYCDNAHRSSCAVYLLSACGFEAYVLENGIQAQTSFVEHFDLY